MLLTGLLNNVIAMYTYGVNQQAAPRSRFHDVTAKAVWSIRRKCLISLVVHIQRTFTEYIPIK